MSRISGCASRLRTRADERVDAKNRCCCVARFAGEVYVGTHPVAAVNMLRDVGCTSCMSVSGVAVRLIAAPMAHLIVFPQRFA